MVHHVLTSDTPHSLPPVVYCKLLVGCNAAAAAAVIIAAMSSPQVPTADHQLSAARPESNTPPGQLQEQQQQGMPSFHVIAEATTASNARGGAGPLTSSSELSGPDDVSASAARRSRVQQSTAAAGEVVGLGTTVPPVAVPMGVTPQRGRRSARGHRNSQTGWDAFNGAAAKPLHADPRLLPLCYCSVVQKCMCATHHAPCHCIEQRRHLAQISCLVTQALVCLASARLAADTWRPCHPKVP